MHTSTGVVSDKFGRVVLTEKKEEKEATITADLIRGKELRVAWGATFHASPYFAIHWAITRNHRQHFNLNRILLARASHAGPSGMGFTLRDKSNNT